MVKRVWRSGSVEEAQGATMTQRRRLLFTKHRKLRKTKPSSADAFGRRGLMNNSIGLSLEMQVGFVDPVNTDDAGMGRKRYLHGLCHPSSSLMAAAWPSGHNIELGMSRPMRIINNNWTESAPARSQQRQRHYRTEPCEEGNRTSSRRDSMQRCLVSCDWGRGSCLGCPGCLMRLRQGDMLD